MAVTRLRPEDVYAELEKPDKVRLYLGDPDAHDPNTYYLLDWPAADRLYDQLAYAMCKDIHDGVA